MATQPTNTEMVLRWPEVHARVGLSRSHCHALISKKKFPAPIKLGLRASGWLESEINAWVAERVAKSRPESPVSKTEV